MPECIAIRGDGGAVVIELVGYENERSDDYSDANWIACTVRAACGGVVASMRFSMGTRDLARFATELQQMLGLLTGSARLQTDEQQVSIRIAMRASGGALVEGSVSSAGHPHATMKYSFDSDQSYLREALVAAQKATAAFPELLPHLRG